MFKNLSGSKTYIVAVAGIIYAISGFIWGGLDAQTAMAVIWTAAGLAGLRSGIAGIK